MCQKLAALEATAWVGDHGRTFPVANTTPFLLPGQHLTSLFPVLSITSINFALIIEAQGCGLMQERLRPLWRGIQAHSRVLHCPMVSLHDFNSFPFLVLSFPFCTMRALDQLCISKPITWGAGSPCRLPELEPLGASSSH